MSVPLKFRTAITIGGPSVEATLRQAEYAEDNGYDDVWFGDGGGADALTTAAVVADRTHRVRIGSAVIPVYTRSPAVFAASMLAIDYFARGRFILGLGSSSETMMEGWNGIPLDKPLTRVKETVQLVRAMMRGEKTSFDGVTLRSHGYRQPPVTVPVYMAALRGRMLEAAAEHGDGVILNLFPQRALAQMMACIRAGEARAGKPAGSVEVVCRHQVCVTDNPAPARQVFRQKFAPYYANPVYNRLLTWCGFGDIAATIMAGWAARDRTQTTAAFSDQLVDEIAIIGDRDYCQARIREYAAGGIHTHIITCLTTQPREFEATFAAFDGSRFSF